MRFLLVSDVHLDSSFAWAKLDVARRRRQALRDALAHSIQLAIDQHVDVICCGGDLFEHERVSPDTGQFLRVQFERAHPIPIFIAPGNHDWLGQESLYRRASWSPNVHVFGNRRLAPVSIADGLTLWGGAHFAPAGTPDFLEHFRVDRAGIHVALFHGSVQGSFYAAEPRQQPHAPFRAEEIEAAGLHFALLGHYHAPRDEQRFTYPGNPEPLNFGESGQRGVVIVTIGDEGGVTRDRHSVAVSDVYDLQIDVTGCASKQEIRDRVAAALEGRGGYARLTVTGELAPAVDLHAADFDDLPNSLDSPPIVRLESMTVAYDLGLLAQEPTVRGQFVRDVQASQLEPQERQRVIVTGLRALAGRNDLEVL
jgi:DNA repair protein SbcD/Mre11